MNFKKKAARRATQTKWEIVNFKKKAARRATQTKWEIVNFKKKAARRATQTKWEIEFFQKRLHHPVNHPVVKNQGQDDLAKSQDIILSSCVCVQLCVVGLTFEKHFKSPKIWPGIQNKTRNKTVSKSREGGRGVGKMVLKHETELVLFDNWGACGHPNPPAFPEGFAPRTPRTQPHGS